uniref:Uncharacterized protein n=1 Tax=Escherichia coli TaxID=562 RepID=A0A2K9UZX1_ECOLX|nr:hypothetical protein [Escherichia coli]
MHQNSGIRFLKVVLDLDATKVPGMVRGSDLSSIVTKEQVFTTQVCIKRTIGDSDFLPAPG